ncbi:MAG: hypothetical protein ABL956_10800 [Hyphomonadaceae bacterium]
MLNGPALTSGLAKLLADKNEEQRRAAAVSPLYADPANLPLALFFCETIDPLIDDSSLMAGRWNAANSNARF